MNIMFVAPRMHTNQAPIIKGLIEKGHNISFYVYYKGKVESYEYLNPIIIKRSIFSNMINTIKRINKGDIYAETYMSNIPSVVYFISEIKKCSPDVVILRDPCESTIVLNFICKIMGIKGVILYDQKNVFSKYKWYFRLLLPQVRYTPILAYDMPQDFIFYKSSYYLPLVYNNVRPMRNKASYAKNNIVHILDVGKYRDYKNHFLIVDAAKKVLESGFDNFRIEIVGQLKNKEEKEYYQLLNKKIEEYKLEKYIILKSDIAYEQMTSLYDNSDILILASKREAHGMVVIEALSNGLCVLCSQNVGAAFNVLWGNAGDLFNPKDAQQLADLICKYLKNIYLISELGNNGYRYIKNNVSFDNYYDNLSLLCKNEFGIDITEDVKR